MMLVWRCGHVAKERAKFRRAANLELQQPPNAAFANGNPTNIWDIDSFTDIQNDLMPT